MLTSDFLLAGMTKSDLIRLKTLQRQQQQSTIFDGSCQMCPKKQIDNKAQILIGSPRLITIRLEILVIRIMEPSRVVLWRLLRSRISRTRLKRWSSLWVSILQTRPFCIIKTNLTIKQKVSPKLLFESSVMHSGMFPKVLFRCENVGRQDDFANFWHFLTWI